jgi:hypothetical protein
MKIDVCIVSNAKNSKLRQLTNQTINTLLRAEPDIDFDIVVAEKSRVKYGKDVKVISQPYKFNYNQSLNECARIGNNEFIMFCNNDLIFYEGSISKLLDAFKNNPELMSASSLLPGMNNKSNKYGYLIGEKHEFFGWFFIMRRSAYEEIGGLDECVSAWYSDDVVAKQLEQKKLLHGLIADSYVHHLVNQTIQFGSNKEKQDFVSGLDIFEKKYGKKIW